MPFPFSIQATVEGGPATIATIIADLRQRLEGLKGRDITMHGANEVTFRGGMFRLVTKHNLLVPIGSGRVTVTETATGIALSYDLDTTQTFWVGTIMAVAVAGFLIYAEPADTMTTPVGFAVFLWVWVIGMNYLIARWRFRKFAEGLVGKR